MLLLLHAIGDVDVNTRLLQACRLLKKNRFACFVVSCSVAEDAVSNEEAYLLVVNRSATIEKQTERVIYRIYVPRPPSFSW